MLPGQSLKRVIHMARAAAGIPSDLALATAAGVRYQTLMDWYAERNRPTPGPLSKVAEALDISVADLWAAWEGRQSTSSDVAVLVDALNRQTDAITTLVSELRASLRGVERGLEAAAKLREGASSGAPNAPRSHEGARP